KSACWNIDVLSFDLQPLTTFSPCPVFGRLKKSRADTLAANFRCDSKIPQHRKVRAIFQHLETWRVKGHDCSADYLILDSCSKDGPIRHIKSVRPTDGILNSVVVFQVRMFKHTFGQNNPR